MVEEENQMTDQVHVKKNQPDDDIVIREVTQLHPISDFKSMMSNRSEDLVDSAINQMNTVVLRLVEESINGSHYNKAIDCLLVLREGCLDEEEMDLFNNTLTGLRNKYKGTKNNQFWNQIVKKGKFLYINVRYIFDKQGRKYTIKSHGERIIGVLVLR